MASKSTGSGTGSVQTKPNTSEQRGGVRIEFSDMQNLYLTAQRYYRRPALSLLTDSQLRHYIPEIANWKHRTDIRGMFEVLTSKDTRPEYYDTIVNSYRRSAEVRDMHERPMKEKELMSKVDDEIFQHIELKERTRKEELRAKARRRREERKAAAEAAKQGLSEDVSHWILWTSFYDQLGLGTMAHWTVLYKIDFFLFFFEFETV